MKDEMESLLDNEIWKLMKLSLQFELSVESGVPSWNQEKMVRLLDVRHDGFLKGLSQTQGIDYNETFASVVKPQSYKAARDWELEQMDPFSR